MREINETQDAEDHRVTQGDERVNRTLSEPVNELLDKFDHGATKSAELKEKFLRMRLAITSGRPWQGSMARRSPVVEPSRD